MANIVYETETVNHTTGEVTTSTKHKKFRSDEPNYIKLYLNDIAYLYNLPSSSSSLVFELLSYLTYNTQEIVLNAATRKRIAEKLEVSVRTLNNRIVKLKNAGIISSDEAGIYVLNPYLFGKGDWKSIKELRNNNLGMKIVYDKETNTRKVQGSIEDA